MKIYLDNAATTPVRKEAINAMLPYLDKKYGNASSLHSFGREARDAIEESRQKIAKIINEIKKCRYICKVCKCKPGACK